MESLTLIVPSYNNARYLKDLINSVFGGETSLGTMSPQTLLPDQVVIVDDCSTDNTEEVVSDLSKLNTRIEYHRMILNGGTSIACNEGIKKSVGRFITRIDADDMRESWSFEKMMRAQMEHPDSYIYDDTVIFLRGARQNKVWKMSDYSFFHLLEQNINHAGIMFSKASWRLSGGYPPEFRDGRDDWAFNVALGAVGCCGIHIDSAGYLYRREGQNRTLKNSSPERQKYYYDKMQSHFKELYLGRWNMACCGNREKRPASPQPTRAAQTLSGSSGMTILQYNGENYGKEPFFGPVTGTMYVFSKTSPLRNVDNRDLHTPKFKGLLDLTLNGRPIFSIKEIPVEAPLASPPKIEVIEEIKVEEIKVEEVKVESTESPAVETSTDGTTIQDGQVEGIGKKEISKLSSSGISTWESFVLESSVSLASITGKSVDEINAMKEALTQE
jgi:glycosyltransferase involved in cell wall biosynthesis